VLQELFLVPCGLLAFCSVLLVAARIVIARASRNKTYSNVLLVPWRHVGLVLGCPTRTRSGSSNAFFENRIAAAAELYHHGKVDYLVVSGGNRVRGDGEVSEMKSALLRKGVPTDRIYVDYGGVRTLDSIARAKKVFGQDRVTIISQSFHNQRAIFLASHRGIDAIGFDAPEVVLRNSFRTRIREQAAKIKAVLDVYLFRTQPHVEGQKIDIGGS
jgi:SanA protein